MELHRTLFESLKLGNERLAVVGLGYVGMPLAIEFAKKFSVIGFDASAAKIALYRSGKDPTNGRATRRPRRPWSSTSRASGARTCSTGWAAGTGDCK